MKTLISLVTFALAIASHSATAKTEPDLEHTFGDIDQPTLIFPDGSMVSTRTHRKGYGIYHANLYFYDSNFNQKYNFTMEIDDKVEWMSAAPDGSVWLYSDDKLAGSKPNTITYNTRHLIDASHGIVTTNNTFVIFDRTAKKLVELTNLLNEVTALSYESCSPFSGYFQCRDSSGNTEYVDVETMNPHGSTNGFLKRSQTYALETRNDYRVVIKDQNGNELYNKFLFNEKPLDVAIADNYVAIQYRNSLGRIVVTDWQGNTIENLGSPAEKNTLIFHPSGYLMWGKYKFRKTLLLPNTQVTKFEREDYLNTHNPNIINNYTINAKPYTATGNPDSPDVPSEPESPKGGVSTSGGSSSTWLFISIALLAAFRGKKAKK